MAKIIDLKITHRGFRVGCIVEPNGYRAAWISSLDKNVWRTDWRTFAHRYMAEARAMKCIDRDCEIEIQEVALGRKLTAVELNQMPLI